jgi:lipopolysaccharide/colanic/teichoic acid biosynthesis glycosyltransferase
MSQPQIIAHKDGGMSFVGPAAVDVYRITMLASSIKMYAACGIIPTRGVGITRMLQMAGEYTRKVYKRKDMLQAAADLKELATVRADIIQNG